MARRVTYSIVDCVDGRFAVVVVAVSGATYRRGGLLTMAEAEACIEDLRLALAGCGFGLVDLERSAGMLGRGQTVGRSDRDRHR